MRETDNIWTGEACHVATFGISFLHFPYCVRAMELSHRGLGLCHAEADDISTFETPNFFTFSD